MYVYSDDEPRHKDNRTSLHVLDPGWGKARNKSKVIPCEEAERRHSCPPSCSSPVSSSDSTTDSDSSPVVRTFSAPAYYADKSSDVCSSNAEQATPTAKHRRHHGREREHNGRRRTHREANRKVLRDGFLSSMPEVDSDIRFRINAVVIGKDADSKVRSVITNAQALELTGIHHSDDQIVRYRPNTQALNLTGISHSDDRIVRCKPKSKLLTQTRQCYFRVNIEGQLGLAKTYFTAIPTIENSNQMFLRCAKDVRSTAVFYIVRLDMDSPSHHSQLREIQDCILGLYMIDLPCYPHWFLFVECDELNDHIDEYEDIKAFCRRHNFTICVVPKDPVDMYNAFNSLIGASCTKLADKSSPKARRSNSGSNSNDDCTHPTQERYRRQSWMERLVSTIRQKLKIGTRKHLDVRKNDLRCFSPF